MDTEIHNAALAAYRGISFSPDVRAKQEEADYINEMIADRRRLAELANTDEKRDILDVKFTAYQHGYRVRLLAYLHARSRVMSPMITGPARFPVERNRKASESAHKRLTELLDYRERATRKIQRDLTPEARPIMSGDTDAIERLTKELEEAKNLQSLMKRANKIVLSKSPNKPEELAAIGLPGCEGFQPSRLSNNNASIRRMEQRLAKLKRDKAAPNSTTDGANARLEDCPADNRVRLFFPDKPDADVRSRLKSRGFRWTPSLGCWQAYRNATTIDAATTFAG